MSTKIDIRNLTRIFGCPASAHTGIDRYPLSRHETLDRAVRAVLDGFVEADPNDDAHMENVGRTFGLAENEIHDLAVLTQTGRILSASLRHGLERTFPAQRGSARLTNRFSLHGFLDLWGPDADDPQLLHVYTYQTGQPGTLPNNTAMGLAALALHKARCCQAAPVRVLVHAVWLRTGKERQIVSATLKDIRFFRSALLELVSKQDPSTLTVPNYENCAKCPLFGECKPCWEYMRRAFWIIDSASRPTDLLTIRNGLAEAYDAAVLWGKKLEQFNDAARISLEQEGPLALADGRTLRLAERTRETLCLTEQGSDVLGMELGEPDARAVLARVGGATITKTGLAKCLPDLKGKEKQERVDAIVGALDAAGCVRRAAYSVIQAQ